MNGSNVSGFVLCYDNRSIQGTNRFAARNLKFTSAYVEEQVQYKVLALPMRASMMIVLDKLSGNKTDM